MKYEATSLADIADQFDRNALQCTATAERQFNVRDAMAHRRAASVWHEAANFLRNTTLTTDGSES